MCYVQSSAQGNQALAEMGKDIMDIRNQGHTIFSSVAKAEAFVVANVHALIEGEAYEVRKNPKGETAIVMFSIDGVEEGFV